MPGADFGLKSPNKCMPKSPQMHYLFNAVVNSHTEHLMEYHNCLTVLISKMSPDLALMAQLLLFILSQCSQCFFDTSGQTGMSL